MSSTDNPSNKRDMSANTVNMFSAPAKKQRRGGTQNDATTPLLDMTAAQIHNKDVSSTERYSFVGYLIDVPNNDRIVKVYNKKNKEQPRLTTPTELSRLKRRGQE